MIIFNWQMVIVELVELGYAIQLLAPSRIHGVYMAFVKNNAGQTTVSLETVKKTDELTSLRHGGLRRDQDDYSLDGGRPIPLTILDPYLSTSETEIVAEYNIQNHYNSDKAQSDKGRDGNDVRLPITGRKNYKDVRLSGYYGFNSLEL